MRKYVNKWAISANVNSFSEMFAIHSFTNFNLYLQAGDKTILSALLISCFPHLPMDFANLWASLDILTRAL